MKHLVRCVGLLLLLAVGLVCGTGCVAVVAGAAAGAGTVAYVAGELQVTENVPLDKAWAATEKAMKDLELTPVTRSKDALSAELVARGSGDKKVTVKLKNVGEKATEIRIRIGTFGDKAFSQMILDRIKKHF